MSKRSSKKATLPHQIRKKNEAEIQIDIPKSIRKALPLLPADIKIEHHLHLKLGHHEFTIDGTDPKGNSISGRYDVLVLVEGKPLLIAEIKAPSVKLDEADVHQALSYARLHQPLVPLVMVTNGDDVIVRRTYDNSSIDANEVAEGKLQNILQTAATMAKALTDDAIATLLGNSRSVWKQLFKSWSIEAISSISGDVRDFSRPVSNNFSIQRELIGVLEEHLNSTQQIAIVHGPPLSGITNLLTQLALSSKITPVLFINSEGHADILQFIANKITRELNYGVSKNELRNWINAVGGLAGTTILVDGLPSGGIDELVDYVNHNLLKLVLGVNTETYAEISSSAGRTSATLLGRSSKPFALGNLTDNEFVLADNELNKINLGFFPGAQHSDSLRLPRRLRVLAASAPSVPNAEPGLLRLLPAIPSISEIQTWGTTFNLNSEANYLLTKVFKCFLSDAGGNQVSAGWLSSTYGAPSIDPDLILKQITDSQLDKLISLGYVSWTNTRNIGPRIIIRFEELLAHGIADIWAQQLVDKAGNTQESIENEVKSLLKLIHVVPMGEATLATSIYRASQKRANIYRGAMHYFLNQEPLIANLSPEAKVNILSKDTDLIIDFAEIELDPSENKVYDISSWMVASHLASITYDNPKGGFSPNYHIFTHIGTFKEILYSPSPRNLKEVKGFMVHQLGDSLFVCPAEGIVEPIVQAIVLHSELRSNELVSLAEWSVEKNQLNLAWRVFCAAKVIQESNSQNKLLQQAALKAYELLETWIMSAHESAHD